MRGADNKVLTEGPIGSSLARLAAQMWIGLVGSVAFSLVDAWFVGQLGPTELAAMGYVLPAAMVVMGLAFGLGTGTATVVARAIGGGDRYRVQRLTTDALTLAVAVVFVVVLAGLATMDPVFRAMGADAETLPLIKEYMTIWYGGVIFLVVPMVGNNALRATGDARTPALIMTVAVVVNAVLDPVLIFGLGPFPRMELAGAALATLIARATTLVVALYALHVRHGMITRRRPAWQEGLRSWRAVLYVGLPNAATNIVLPLGAGLITRMVSEYGEEAVAAFGVASRIDMFAMTPVMALGAILGPFVGQNQGAQQPQRLREGVRLALRFSVLWGTAMAVLLAFLAEPLAVRFNDDPQVVGNLVLYLALVPVGYGLRSSVNLAKVVMNSLNRPLPGSLVTLGQMFVLYVPLAWLGARLLGLAGLFFAATVAGALAALWGLWWLRRVLRQCAPPVP